MTALSPEERAAIEARHRLAPASVWDIPPSGGADDYRCRTDGDRNCDAARLLAALTAAEARAVEVGLTSERRFWMDGLRTMVAGPGELPHEADPNDPDLGAALARQWRKELAEPQMVVVPPPDSLDAALAETEAALPAGWYLFELRRLRLGRGLSKIIWQAIAGPERSDFGPHVLPERVTAEDPSAAAALRALAAKLRGRGA